jgi:hypothetical protein
MTSADIAAVTELPAPAPAAAARRTEPVTILAAYICRPCDIQGRDTEMSPGEVLCWNCGAPALITARVAG